MKNRVVPTYSFNAAARTITSNELTSIERIVMIVNQTDGIIIYDPSNPLTIGTLSGGVLTLAYDTTSMSNTDKLIIYVDKPHSDWKWSFAKNVANNVDSSFGRIVGSIGSGMTVNQTGGNLVINTGANAFAETTIRTNQSFDSDMLFRYGLTLSQRIINQNFSIEMTDVIGDNLAMTINSATSVTVTVPGTTWNTTDNAGQGVWIGMSTVASVPTQRAVIASVSGNNVTLTVTGFPASGTGTCSLFGYNYHQIVYSGAVVTNFGTGYATQRLGWVTNHGATTSVSSTVGHIVTLSAATPYTSEVMDETIATSTATNNGRMIAKQNVPEGVPLFLQIRVYNGATAPLSATTMTLAFVTVSNYEPQKVSIAHMAATFVSNPMPVQQQGSITVATITTMPALVAGTAVIGDVGVQYRANATGAATASSVISPATPAATSLKATAGRILAYSLTNTSTGVRSVKIFNVAAPTLGTTAAAFEIDIPAGQTVTFSSEGGIAATTAIVYSVTSAKGLTDNTATGLALGDVSGFIAWA